MKPVGQVSDHAGIGVGASGGAMRAGRIGPRHTGTDARWYLVHAQTGREPIAEINLRRQGYQAFLPKSLRTTRHARKLRTMESAYFPGYLFVSLDLATQDWSPINGTLGVIRIFAIDTRPTPVPAGVVERLIAGTNSSGFLDLTPPLAPGDSVRLIAGPFAETLGTVQGLNSSNRVRVILSIMNQEIVTDLPQADCEAINGSPQSVLP